MTTAEGYIDKVLDTMPAMTPQRTPIAAELRGHIAERLAGGQPLDAVLRQLGDPVELAASYLAAEPLVPVTFARRAAAKAIDVLCVEVALAPVAVVCALLVARDVLVPLTLGILLAGGTLLFPVYTAVAERGYGRTLGKTALGMHVVTERGLRIGVGQALVRQLPMFLQVFWIDVLFALFTDRHQRAFELLSRTRVVQAQPQGGAYASEGYDGLQEAGRPS